jgi:hypothetical protein
MEQGSPTQRADAAVERVMEALREGDATGARKALSAARALTRGRVGSGDEVEDGTTAQQSPLIPAERLHELSLMIESMPTAAFQVLKHSPARPFAALGIERLEGARSLNSVNRRSLLKAYRRLALELHPDRCEHEMAIEAMQALNAAYDRVLPSGGLRT